MNSFIIKIFYALHWQGGFDMICSGRDKIETPEQVGALCLFTIVLVYHFGLSSNCYEGHEPKDMAIIDCRYISNVVCS